MNFLRENGKSIKTDDNSLKFILIDRNSRKINGSYKDLGNVCCLNIKYTRQANYTKKFKLTVKLFQKNFCIY